MKIDRLVLKEMIGPWVFGVAMFSALLMAAGFLNKIADYIVHGLPGSLILKITLLLMPAILAKTFAMSMLLSGLLAFGRLSSDSEITALRAAGASLFRILRPVMMISLFVAIVTFFFNNQVVPPAASEARALIKSIENGGQLKVGDPVSFPIVEDKKIKAQVVAQRLDVLHGQLENVTIIAYDEQGNKTFFLDCKTLRFRDKNDWTISGGARIIPADGRAAYQLQQAWPTGLAKLNKSIDDIDALSNPDLDVYSMSDTLHQIDKGRIDGIPDSIIHNLEYGYWNKISVALAAFVFGTLGAVLGIRNQRAGTATGFAQAVGIIFGYFMLANFMAVWANSGVLPAWAASFAPVVIGLVCSGVIMWRRNI